MQRRKIQTSVVFFAMPMRFATSMEESRLQTVAHAMPEHTIAFMLFVYIQGKGIFSDLKEEFCNDVRQIQRRTKCSEATVVDFLATFEKYIDCPTAGIMAKSLRECDKIMQQRAGVNFIILNGCPQCEKFVYTPDDKRSFCPYVLNGGAVCGAPRYNADGKPKEVLIAYIIYCN